MNNSMELSFKINNEEMEKFKKILTSGGVRHYLIKITNGEELDVVEYKEYQKLEQENQKLKEQLGKYKIELEKADSITQSCIFDGKKESKISYRKLLNLVKKNKTQQKEFIEWLENLINNANKVLDNPKEDEENKSYLLSRKFVLEHVLSQYKEIIGVDNE